MYDGFVNEFEIAKKRIMVPLSMAKIQLNDNGSMKPVFDKNDVVFYGYPSSRDGNDKIECQDMSIRAQEHQIGINNALDMLSFKCGLGAGRYRFENGTVKTATEIISADSDLFRNLKKHEIIIDSALRGMINAIAFLQGKGEVSDITIDFDDSIIEDKASERAQDRQDVSMGVMRLEEYRAKWYGETIEEAAANLPVPEEIEPGFGE